VHVRQRYTWDCGLACVAAAVGIVNGDAAAATLAGTLAELQREVDGTSVWTVELALMLHRRGLSPSFFSILLGIDPAHAALPFYSSVLAVDEPRITSLFAIAATMGLRMNQQHVNLDTLCHRLASKQSVFIVLVDARKLRCHRCMLFNTGSLSMSFVGHYVLLTGYRYAEDEFELMDPSSWAPARCYTSAEGLEAARLAAGTDEDLIEVPLGKSAAAEATTDSPSAAAAGATTATL